MKTKFRLIIGIGLVVFLGLFMPACTHKEGCTDPNAENYDPDAEVDNGTCQYPTPPAEATLTITSPQEGAMIASGDTLHINATATSTETLHGYKVFIINKSDQNTEVFAADDHTHASTLSIHHQWVNAVMHHSDGFDHYRKHRS